jgi:hypothetical protein
MSDGEAKKGNPSLQLAPLLRHGARETEALVCKPSPPGPTALSRHTLKPLALPEDADCNTADRFV